MYEFFLCEKEIQVVFVSYVDLQRRKCKIDLVSDEVTSKSRRDDSPIVLCKNDASETMKSKRSLDWTVISD